MIYDLKTIDTAYGKNMGGGQFIRFFPKEWLEADLVIDVNTGWLVPFDNIIFGPFGGADVTFKSNFLDHSIVYQEQLKNSDSGDYYEVTIAGTVLRDDPERAHTLNNLRYYEYVVLYHGHNYAKGDYKVIGNRLYGMKFMPEFNSGTQPKDAAKYSLGLKFTCQDAPPYVHIPDSAWV